MSEITPTRKPAACPTARGVRRIMLLALIAAVAAWALDAVIDRGLRKIATGDCGVMNKIVGGRINTDIVISGSSRALVNYDTRVLSEATGKSTYNIALNASRIDLQLALLKTYLAHNSKPQIVVQNLDLHSLALTRELYDPAQYFPYLGEKQMFEAIAAINPDAWKWKGIPLYGYAMEDMRYHWMRGLVANFGLQPGESRINGFEPRDLVWSGEFESFKKANPSGVTIDFEESGVRVLEQLIRLCHDQGIQLVLVYSPEFCEMIPLAKNRDRIFQEFRALARAHGVPFWDFSESMLGTRRELFYNSQHMNRMGAEMFSTELAHKLQSVDLAVRNARALRIE